MTELKTLKDLECEEMYNDDWRKIVKQEAIKWIKENAKKENTKFDYFTWMKFFNITEEYLK